MSADTKPAADGEKLQFSGVNIIEIGQSHLPTATDKPAADAKPAAAAADAKPAEAAKPADAEADKKPDSLAPAASAAQPNGSLKEPLTPSTPAPTGGATPSTAPATPATDTRAIEKADAKAALAPAAAAADKKDDKKPADEKKPEKKKEKKDAKPTRNVNPALAARVRAANQFNRRWKAAKEDGLEGDQLWAAASGGSSRRPTKIESDTKKDDGAPVVIVETEAERMRRERREKKDRLNLSEKIQHYKVEIDPELEARVAAVENQDDTGAMPDVSVLMKDNDRSGVLEERSSAVIGYRWTPYTCVIHGGHFYWIKDEKKDKEAVGRVKFTKAKVRMEINDSVLELYDPDVPKKQNQTRYFRVPEAAAVNSSDFVDSWLLAIKKAKLKFYQTRVIALQKEEEKQRKESGQTVPSAAVLSPQAAKAAALAAKRKAAQQLLAKGIQLMKHQAGTRYARAVWCTANMDRLCWGDPKMESVKGFVLLDDITEVVGQIALATKPGSHALAVVHSMHSFSGTDEAVLQFECDDQHLRDEWLAALKLFVDKQHHA